MGQKQQILFPVGRLVQGSLYTPNTEDAEGKPLTVRFGANAGQPRVDYYFAFAIPKNPQHIHWATEPEWGAIIWAIGHAGFPGGQAQRDDFAWKIIDGDSGIPNKAGRKPVDNEGWKGHWILKFGGGYAPKICNIDGTKQLLEKDFVNLGDYIQVAGTVADNESTQQPGIYLNHQAVAFYNHGQRIIVGIDTKTIGFGKCPMPPGASPTPPVSSFNPDLTPPVPPATPYAAPAAAPYSPPAPPVTPHTQILTPPPIPPVPAAPMQPQQRIMLPAANGNTYETMIANGWNDQMLIANGMMQA